MEIYDVLMVAILAAAALFGAWKGLAWQVASVGSIIISYFVALTFRGPVAAMIDAAAPWNMFLAMLLLYVGSSAAVWIGFNMVRGAINRFKLKEWDRQIGALLGLAKGGLLCILSTFFALMLLGPTQREQIIHSNSGYAIAVVIHNADAVMPKEVGELVGPYLEDFGEKLARPLGEGHATEGVGGMPLNVPGPLAPHDSHDHAAESLLNRDRTDDPLDDRFFESLGRFLRERAVRQ
jgi:membrane protein required for colicin V production